jgi:parvulin-like peptidyl-prolyl isomerase
MTFRAKPVRRNRAGSGPSRRTLYTNLAFGAVVVVAVRILAAAAGASWDSDHFGSVAIVGGQTVTRDQYRDRYAVESFRLNQVISRIRDEFQAGHLTQADRDSEISALQQQETNLQQVAYERLIDVTIQDKLASDQGLTTTPADIDAAIAKEATTPELRHSFVISVAPKLATGETSATDAEKAAAKATADQALADLTAGKAWNDVSKADSGDTNAATGGDLGWISQQGAPDTAFGDALFAAQPNTPTAVIAGSDGTYRIGRVTDVAKASVDAHWTAAANNAGISTDTYRTVVGQDALAGKLQDAIVSGVVDKATAQRHVAEIYISTSTQHQGGGDEVQVRHILFAPNHLTDQTALGALPSNDPAWTVARNAAQAAYDQLKAYIGRPDEMETQFKALADKLTDDASGKGSGGSLPYFTQADVDPAFGDAIFKAGLKKGDLIGPVRSQFGYHVILFEDRRPNPEGRINAAATAAGIAGTDFATVAKQYSEGPQKDTGGDLGWIARDQLPQQQEDAIFATPVGKISQIVDVTGDGFYLFKVLDEQTRKPDAAQAETLRQSAFTNWYAVQKAKVTVDRQLSFPAAS